MGARLPHDRSTRGAYPGVRRDLSLAGMKMPPRLAVALALAVPLLLSEGLARADCPAEAVRYAASSNRLYISGPVTCTPSDLDPLVSHAALERTSKARMIWILRASLILEDGATLVLAGEHAGGDVNELRLRSDDAEDGVVFIRADWGAIDIAATRITSWDEAAGAPDLAPDRFGRAFIHVRSRAGDDGVTPRESRMDIRNSDLAYLGYDGPEAQGVVWKAMDDSGARVLGDVVENRFHDSYRGATAIGGAGMTFIGNQLDHNLTDGLVLQQDSDAIAVVDSDIHDNARHGLVCSERCVDLDLRNSRVTSNGGDGVVASGAATGLVLEDNELRGNVGSGLALLGASGSVVRNNVIADNGRGIEVGPGSHDNLFERNRLDGNDVGLYVDRAHENGFVQNNVFGSPRGLHVSRADENQLFRNIFGRVDELVFIDARDNVLHANVIPEEALVRVRTGALDKATTIVTQGGGFPQAASPLRVDITGGGEVVFRETTTYSHLVAGASTETRVTPGGSTLVLGAGPRRVVSAVPIFLSPASGQLRLLPLGATSWQVRAVAGTRSVTTEVARLEPGERYDVRRDGALLVQVTATEDGTISFTDAVGGAPVTYVVVPTAP